MAAKIESRPAGRGVKDKEVLSTRHDALLTWAIENLVEIVATTWAVADSEKGGWLESARRDASESLESQYRRLSSGDRYRGLPDWMLERVRPATTGQRWEIDPDLNLCSPTRLAIEAAFERCQAIEDGIASYRIDLDLTAKVEGYNVMEQVCSVTPRAYGEDKRKPEGFVDIAAQVFLPAGIKISVGKKHLLYLYDDDAGIERYLQEFADSITPSSLEAHVEGSKKTIWISVRTDPFTLGQVLQELKAMQQYESKNQVVTLAVETIDPAMRRNIEREGFRVIVRDEF